MTKKKEEEKEGVEEEEEGKRISLVCPSLGCCQELQMERRMIRFSRPAGQPMIEGTPLATRNSEVDLR